MWPKLFLFIVGLFITLDDVDVSSLDSVPHNVTQNTTSPTPNTTHSGSSSGNSLTPSLIDDEYPSPTTNPTTHTDSNTNPQDHTKNEVNSETGNNQTPHHQAQNDDVDDPNALNVHLMITPHTDAGWIYTFESYYQGTKTGDGGCVKCILNYVMDSFKKNPERKFDMSEVSYFNRWWADQDEDGKAAFKEYLKKNQFGFMNGAWVANDEATAYYDDIMDNFILGHRWLKDNLGTDANIGWQVDSFGNSATHAALMAQAGYDAMFFSRADYVDRAKRKQTKSLQYNWAPPNPHNESVFTQMLYLGYSDARFVLPQGAGCRSMFCKGNLNEGEYSKVEKFVKEQAQSFNTKNVLLLICDDFLMSSGAETYFAGAEAMIQYYKDHPEKGLKVRFSHISDYVAQVQKDMIAENLISKIPYKHDDTYPYIEDKGHVWTGYFTSKPMYKMLVRHFSGYYNAAKLFLTKALLLNDPEILDPVKGQSSVNKALNTLEQSLSIIQHHDSVTGTMKSFVRVDYETMMNKARGDAEAVLQPVMVDYLNQKIGENLTPAHVDYDWLYQDGDYNHIFDGQQTPTFLVFNPGNAGKQLIKVKVPGSGYAILDESNSEVPSDLICHSQDAKSDCFVYFTGEFASYSSKAYKIIASAEATGLTSTACSGDSDTTITLGATDSLALSISKNLVDFHYKYCVNQDTCTSDSFHLDYYYYPSSAAWGGKPPSGAYIFNPNSQEKQPYSEVVSGRVYKGKTLTLLQIFRNNSRTDIKIAHHQLEKGLEVDTFLDPVKENGKEIVMAIKSNSINNGDTVFYTDSNGYFMEKRVKNHKDDYDITVDEGIAINYYPMTSNMYIEDPTSTQRLSLVTDRAQGVSSLKQGEMEVMIHRVTLRDDWKGVNEVLQEKDKNGAPIQVTTRHYISYSQPSVGIKDQRRQQQYNLDRAPYLWFFVSGNSKFVSTRNIEGDELVLPNLVKFFVRSYQPNEYIVRLNNLDDNDAKKVEIYDPVTKECVLLNKFAGKKGYQVESVTELAWMTTKNKSQISRNVLDPLSPDPMSEHDKNYTTIDLVPMEIRTFSIKIKA